MINKIQNHKVTKGSSRFMKFVLYGVIFLLIPLAAFSLLTSKTETLPGWKSFIVVSGSMEPTLPVGSMIYTQKQVGYGIGEVIAFKNAAGQTVTHRIVDVKDDAYVTKGDANKSTDAETVPMTSVIGKTTFTLPQIGSFISYLKTPFGFFAILMVPCLIFMLLEFLNIKKEVEKEVDKRVMERLNGTRTVFEGN